MFLFTKTKKHADLRKFIRRAQSAVSSKRPPEHQLLYCAAFENLEISLDTIRRGYSVLQSL